MEKLRPWCGQPSDRGRLRNRTEQNSTTWLYQEFVLVLPSNERVRHVVLKQACICYYIIVLLSDKFLLLLS